ncbi:hydrolase [Rheinheimera phage Barba8S]|uniref:Uncharacterized protein n=1 Tax=Rheinheimera phage Barba8S TaxID=2849600 RepID=A0A4P8N1Y8_9CAUD|nr:hydrolase [Rheinheimera phage Barba8S]QCQ59689.1 hypothetical protein Barba8S_gp058 [Rheinheimera phage Barba8S]
MEVKMRAYFFQNFYLQGIHAGIQSQHTTAEMFVKYSDQPNYNNVLFEWASKHKTTIVLNGGMQKDLLEIVNVLEDLPYPFAYFREEQDALNGAVTNVGVILPEVVYVAPRTSDAVEFGMYCAEYDLSDEVMDFIVLLQSKRLMN